MSRFIWVLVFFSISINNLFFSPSLLFSFFCFVSLHPQNQCFLLSFYFLTSKIAIFLIFKIILLTISIFLFLLPFPLFSTKYFYTNEPSSRSTNNISSFFYSSFFRVHTQQISFKVPSLATPQPSHLPTIPSLFPLHNTGSSRRLSFPTLPFVVPVSFLHFDCLFLSF